MRVIPTLPQLLLSKIECVGDSLREQPRSRPKIRVCEVGYGSGLDALEALKTKQDRVLWTGIDESYDCFMEAGKRFDENKILYSITGWSGQISLRNIVL